MKKKNVTIEKLMSWDTFSDKDLKLALQEIYEHAGALSQKERGWYWASIGAKRRGSTFTRAVGYVLGTVGVVAPLLAAFRGEPADRLVATQLGVAALAVAASIQLFDKVFGWSSGWLRYIVTVMEMETLTQQFELAWAGYFIAKKGPIVDDDRAPLFALVKQFEEELLKRKITETNGWVAEFNSGTAALNDMLRAQKDVTEKAAQRASDLLDAQVQANKHGAIQVVVTQAASPAHPVVVYLDDDEKEKKTFVGSVWAMRNVEPGTHLLHVALQDGASSTSEARHAVQVPAGGVVTVDVKL